jgi:predicted XRE-type DNA-binding protein
MQLRSRLMIAITEAVSGWRVTQTEAANRLGVTQPRLNDLLRGRVGKFSLDALVALAARAGLAMHLEITLAARSPHRYSPTAVSVARGEKQ